MIQVSWLKRSRAFSKHMTRERIGCIGQGWIGKNYADDFERRGFAVVRYALEEPYAGNKERIAECDIVFIAVPTPSTPKGFDDSIVRAAIELTRDDATIVIKSTIVPGTTESIQEQFPTRFVNKAVPSAVPEVGGYILDATGKKPGTLPVVVPFLYSPPVEKEIVL